MDKFRRIRKPSPVQQNPTATSSSLAGAPASSSSTKFTIEQKVTGGAVKKGPYSVKRTVDPNEVVIKRRHGEGSKPLFSRVDICVNRSVSPKNQIITRDASSSDSSSPEDRNRNRANSSKSKVNKRKSIEKVPYFLDQKREKDRIKRVYGQSSRRSRSLSYERRRKTARSRSRTPPSYHRRHRSYGERRSPSPSRDRYRPRHRTDYSRSRSRSRERRRLSHHSRRNGSMVDERQVPIPTTQYIPIPVPMEYPYIQPSWGPPMMPPQPRFPYVIRPPLPPPIPYIPRHYRPPRFVSNIYQRGNFRPRQY